MSELFPHLVPEQKVGSLDAWYTPTSLAFRCVKYLLNDRKWAGHALEPHAGSGAWVRAWLDLRKQNTAVAWDINPDAPALHLQRRGLIAQNCRDFLEDVEDPSLLRNSVDYIIGNPPYSAENEVGVPHVERALLMAKRGVAFILPLYFLANGGRYERLHSVHPPSDVLIITPRPSFGGSGGAHEVALVIWQRTARVWPTRFGWLHDPTGQRWRS